MHYPAAHGGTANVANATLTTAVDEWHTYQLWWTPDSIKIGVDGTEADAHLVYSKPANATNDTWPYDGPMDMILNIAIGGTLGGTVPTSSFEYAMDVDYVRIYQIESLTPDTGATFTLDANDAVVFADGPVNVTNLDPDWQQATDLQEITDTEAGEVLKFSNFNYQGIEIVEQDLSGKEHLHLDVWSATDGTIKVGPVSVSTGEHLIEFNVIGGQWNAIDLDMADFAAAGKDLTDIHQIKFDTGLTPVSEFYVDNLAFTGTVTSTTPVVVTGPPAPAPSVTLVAGDIDLYVQADTNGDALGGVLTNPNPGWGQAGSAATIAHSSAGEVIHVQNLNYQGMEMVSTDVSGKTSMHIDLWSADSGAVKFFLVAANNGGEAGIVLDVIGGQWNSFDIDLAAFEPATSGEIFQLKLDSQSGAIGTKTPLTDFYMDNLYFGDQTPTIGTPPSDPSSAAFLAGAVDPSAAAADVVSLFSDAYATSVMDGGTFRAGWSSAGAVEELTIDNGNVIKKFNDVVYVGIEAATPYDVSAMGSLKINIWRTEDSDLLIKVRDYGSNGVYDSSGDDAEAVLTIPASDMPKDQWVTVDIPMSDLVTAGLATTANIAQLVLDPENDETFYIDDIYWQAPGNTGHSGQDITVTGVAVAAGAAQIELSGVGFDAAFASSFLTNYTGGITYHVDGTTDVPILLADILSVIF